AVVAHHPFAVGRKEQLANAGFEATPLLAGFPVEQVDVLLIDEGDSFHVGRKLHPPEDAILRSLFLKKFFPGGDLEKAKRDRATSLLHTSDSQKLIIGREARNARGVVEPAEFFAGGHFPKDQGVHEAAARAEGL